MDNGFVDTAALRLNPMPEKTRQFDNLVNNEFPSQFKTAMGGHVFSENYKEERVAFFSYFSIDPRRSERRLSRELPL